MKKRNSSVVGKAESPIAPKGKDRFDPLIPKRKSFESKNSPVAGKAQSSKGREGRDPSDSIPKRRNFDYDNSKHMDGTEDKFTGYSIYIFNLAPEATDTDLWSLFAPFGSIKSVSVVKDSDSLHNKGYGFVTMKNLEEASQAIEILNGQSMGGRPLKISFKGKKNENDSLGDIGAYPLYVYNLAQRSEEGSLWKLFSQFGAVKNVSIVRDSTTNMSKGYAFVTMRNVDDATTAIKTLNGFVLDGRQLSVSFKNKKSDEEESPEINENQIGEYHIYINNLAPNAEDFLLWKLFGQFGAIKDVNLVKDSDTKKCLGYGFVTMKNFDDANLAINTLNNSKLEDKVIHVSFKTKKNK